MMPGVDDGCDDEVDELNCEGLCSDGTRDTPLVMYL